MAAGADRSPSALTLRDVVKTYDDVVAVDAVSLDVRAGEFVTLLGPSGCGKTTTLRMIAGFVEPDSGEILIGSSDVTRLPPNKRDIGMVFQSYGLFPHMTVEDNVAYGLRMRRVAAAERRRRVEEALGLVQLPGLARRYPRQLSGGQQQRVALARAIVIRPSLLLLDEPLSNLDAKLREEMRWELRRLQRQLDITTVFVTHDQEEALAISDRIVVMNAGRVEQIGTQTDIYLQPETRFVAEFIGANNGLEGTIASVEGSGEDARATVSVGDLTLRARARDGLSVGDAVIAYLRPEDVRVLEDGEVTDGRWPNVVEGVVDRVIFEGPTAQLRVNLGGREIRADVSGNRRLTVGRDAGRIVLGFDDLTLIPAEPKA